MFVVKGNKIVNQTDGTAVIGHGCTSIAEMHEWCNTVNNLSKTPPKPFPEIPVGATPEQIDKLIREYMS